MKKTLTIFVLALGSLTAVAQQDPQFSQYMHNKVFMNPAYAGMRRALCLSLIARNQWTGFEGAPQTGVFSGDIYFPGPGKFGSGVGLNVMYDKLGFEKNFRFDLDYSFHIEMGTPGTLAIGLQLGAFNKQIGGPWVATQNWMTDQAIPPT
ncbi:MAG TPA: PorP/SprF family type IX secretion system membrane protein, partial [Bacteroidia bacterium]|nr:PorP/SprF family type IX secretion system membrane protein [Bacteroidia bacterium]